MPKHRLCWADLATVDDRAAATFYAALFGWSPRPHVRSRGRLTMLEDEGTRVASLYRLTRAQIAGNVPSHWLPYVSTPDLSRSVSRAHALGGQVIVNAQRFPGLASIAVVADPTGALIGLWQSDASPGARIPRDDAPATEGSR